MSVASSATSYNYAALSLSCLSSLVYVRRENQIMPFDVIYKYRNLIVQKCGNHFIIMNGNIVFACVAEPLQLNSPPLVLASVRFVFSHQIYILYLTDLYPIFGASELLLLLVNNAATNVVSAFWPHYGSYNTIYLWCADVMFSEQCASTCVHPGQRTIIRCLIVIYGGASTIPVRSILAFLFGRLVRTSKKIPSLFGPPKRSAERCRCRSARCPPYFKC